MIQKLNFILLLWVSILSAECTFPNILNEITHKSINSLSSHNHDIKRNKKVLKELCIYHLTFKEASYVWEMLLITNPEHKQGPFWFLPHDNENTAFDAAVYATQKYGGGFLSIVTNNMRNNKSQDPNRNFSSSVTTVKSCTQHKHPSPKFTNIVVSIIEYYKKDTYPFLALHTNANSWRGGVGTGSVSILSHSKYIHSYPAYKNITSKDTHLRDEDSLIYIAGRASIPNKNILNSLLSRGMHVKYEQVTPSNNDCSMSNYIILNKPTSMYYNIEVQHGALETQKVMIDRLVAYLEL